MSASRASQASSCSVARGVRDPDVLVGEDQHAAEDRPRSSCLVEIGAVGQRRRGALELEGVAGELQVPR